MNREGMIKLIEEGIESNFIPPPMECRKLQGAIPNRDEKGNILEGILYAVLVNDHDIELLETKQITLRNLLLFAEPKYKFYDHFNRFTEVNKFNENNLPLQGITL